MVALFRAAGFFLEGLAFFELMETRLMEPLTGVRFLATVRRERLAGFTRKIGNVLPLGSWIKTEYRAARKSRASSTGFALLHDRREHERRSVNFQQL